MNNKIWLRGETTEYLLKATYTDDNGTKITPDLTGLTIEFQLKVETGDPDPALVTIGVGSGITLRTQSGSTLGWFDLVISSSNLSGVGTPAGVYYFDIAVVIAGERKYVVKPTRVILADVVNQP